MKYYFKAKEKDNKKISGKIEAQSKEELKRSLLENNLYPIVIYKDYNLRFNNKIKDKVLLNFIQDWYSLEMSNVKSQDSLTIIKDNTNSRLLRNVLSLILINLNQGVSIIQSFEMYKSYFPEIFIEMLNIGFINDNMKESLKLLKEYYTDLIANNGKVTSALIYPKILLITIFIAIIVVSKFIVPNFYNLYSEMNITLTGINKFIFDVMLFIGNNIIYITLGVIFLIIIFKYLKSKNKVKDFIDGIKMKLPFFKDIIRVQNTYLFCKSSEILWSNNYNKLSSLNIIKKILPNKKYQNSIDSIEQNIAKGDLFGDALEKEHLFDLNLSKMLIIGEKSNSILTNIKNACTWYSFELQNKTNKMLKVLEPLMIALMSLVVLIIILIIFVPMISSLRGVL